jgi:hypothetical protein
MDTSTQEPVTHILLTDRHLGKTVLRNGHNIPGIATLREWMLVCPLVNLPVLSLCHFSLLVFFVKFVKCFRNVTLVCSGTNNNTPIIAAVSIQATKHVFTVADFPTV